MPEQPDPVINFKQFESDFMNIGEIIKRTKSGLLRFDKPPDFLIYSPDFENSYRDSIL